MTNKTTISSIRHIGSQTHYREESTQTDPFSPAYTISGGEHPEVFALSDFTYGNYWFSQYSNYVRLQAKVYQPHSLKFLLSNDYELVVNGNKIIQ
jgi:hypothetical protein